MAIIRIIVIGDSFAGKTRLLRRFATGAEANDDEFETTIGVDYLDAQVMIAGQEVPVQLWDTAGQEIFRSMTAGWYRRCHACVLVFSVMDRASFDHVKSWHEEVLRNTDTEKGPLPMVLCGNKADFKRREVSQEDALALAVELNMEYFETSAKTGSNVDSMFTSLAREAYVRIKENEELMTVTTPGYELRHSRADRRKNSGGGCC
mmetsp:Transcript_7980/g.27144  ORF Transcript_7980/g.27144 Transcript_7980/m.27144 type:complete len:205 (+) Transcript_7980:138-752(+)